VNELKECLQNKTIDEILNAQAAAEDHINLFSPLGMFMPWSPVVDNMIILEQPLVAFYGGHFKPVPLMIGTVLDEGTMFVDEIFPDGLPAYEYEAILVDVLRRDDKFEEATLLYPPVLDSKNLTGQRLSNLSTDYLFVCASRNLTRSIINNLNPDQAQQVFLYRFEHVPSFYEAWGPNYTFCYFSVCHGAELPFVFHSAGMVIPPYNYTAEEQVLTQQMSNYWGNFAHTGSPNSGPSTVSMNWPVYQNGRLNAWENIVFNTPSTIQKNADNVHCNFWDSVGYLIP
jgi:carboxylesterase type B